VNLAVQGAARRLARQSCALILSDFEDRPGRTLSMRLDGQHMSVTEHIAALRFVDASMSPSCRQTVLAFTRTGSYTIEICALEFKGFFDSVSVRTRRRTMPSTRKSPRVAGECFDDARHLHPRRHGFVRDLTTPIVKDGRERIEGLLATCRLRFVSVALYTSPMPPVPAWAVTS
jgi:hypothetical protein